MMRFFAAVVLALSFVSTALAQDSVGIKVHGYWTIDVLSPEGEVVSHHEFENAFINPGGLATLVMDDGVSGGLYVVMTNQNSGSSGMGPCNPDCEIAAAGMDIGTTPDSTSLTATQIGTNFETIRLAGNVTIANTSSIDLVQSWILFCGDSKPPPQCRANSDSIAVFTSKILSTAINVTAGQIVQVQVDLTFS